MLDWLRLVRLPNLATAAADVLAGFLVCSQASAPLTWPPAACWLAILASAGFYAAGMILNDVYDLPLDRAERPERPLPSGAIAPRAAAAAGAALLTLGAAAACGTAFVAGTPWPALVGAALTAAVWLYDRHAKRTAAGPVVMGACRGLNWLLGMTAAGGPTLGHEWLIPAGMALYVAGITLYARDEAGRPRIAALGGGTLLMLVGLVVAAGHVWTRTVDGPLAAGCRIGARDWLLLWGILSASVLFRSVGGIVVPVPARVRQAVGNAILSIITLDAALVLATCGEQWALVILALVAIFLAGRQIVPPT
ncbi:MAG: UbiA family prenyltransferase [Planctomycetia bacterium]